MSIIHRPDPKFNSIQTGLQVQEFVVDLTERVLFHVRPVFVLTTSPSQNSMDGLEGV